MPGMSHGQRVKVTGTLARTAQIETGIGIELYEDAAAAGTFCVDAAGVRVAEFGTLAAAEGTYQFLAGLGHAALLAVIDDARENG